MAAAAHDLVPDGDPVIDRLCSDLDQLVKAWEFLTYHRHALAAVIIEKEIRNTKSLIGKWRSVHNARLPLPFR